MLVAPAVVATIVEKRAIFQLNSIIAGKWLTANAIHRADEAELTCFLRSQLEASLFCAVIVANESAIGLFHGEHIEQAGRGVNLELSRIMRSTAIRDARCAEFNEMLWMSDSVQGDGVYWDHVDNLF